VSRVIVALIGEKGGQGVRADGRLGLDVAVGDGDAEGEAEGEAEAVAEAVVEAGSMCSASVSATGPAAG